jgi:hypothetical protein
VSEKLLLLEELLEIASPTDSDDERTAPAGTSGAFDDEEDDGFANFEVVKKLSHDASAAENCAKLERATHLFLGLDLEFLQGVDVPAVQVSLLIQLKCAKSPMN